MFIGRSEELGLLEKLYAKNSLNVVLVSGEYKIGKTALLQEFLQKKSAAYFAARNALSTVNLAAFCLELKEQGLWGPKNEFRSWDSVFSRPTSGLQKRNWPLPGEWGGRICGRKPSSLFRANTIMC